MQMTRRQTFWKKTHQLPHEKFITYISTQRFWRALNEEWDNHWNFLPLDVFKDLQDVVNFIQVFVDKVKGKFMK